MSSTDSRPPLLAPLLRRTLDVWTLESRAFLLYGLFMVTAGIVLGQLPVMGLVAALAVDGPLAGGLVLATLRVLQEERPGREDFLGGFRPAARLAGLGMLAMLPATLALAAWLLMGSLATWLGIGAGGVALVGLPLLVVVLVAAVLWSVAVPVMMLEGGAVASALRASARLVRRRPWQVALLQVLLLALQMLLALPTLRDLAGQTQPGVSASLPFLLGLVLLGPLQGILTTLLYLRLREEGTTNLGQG
jgi:hypothetical protein